LSCQAGFVIVPDTDNVNAGIITKTTSNNSFYDSCDFVSFIGDTPSLFISLLKEYPNLFLFLFTVLSILRIYKILRKLIEQEYKKKEKTIYRISFIQILVKYISENQNIYFLIYWSFFTIILFILYSKQISLILNYSEFSILFSNKDYKLARAILGLIASILALVLILRQKNLNEKDQEKMKISALSIVICILSLIWSIILIYSILYDNNIIDYCMISLLKGSSFLFTIGIFMDLNNGYSQKSGMDIMRSNMIDSNRSSSDSESDNESDIKTKKTNKIKIIKEEKKWYLDLAEKIRNFHRDPSPLKTSITASEVKENLSSSDSEEIHNEQIQPPLNQNREPQRSKSGSLFISLAEAKRQMKWDKWEKNYDRWIKVNKSWPLTRVRNDLDVVGIKGTVSPSRSNVSILENPEIMEMNNVKVKWKSFDKDYKLWNKRYFNSELLDDVWMRHQEDMIIDQPDTSSTPAGYLKIRRSIILEHITEKQEQRLRDIEQDNNAKKSQARSRMQRRTIGKSIVDVDGVVDPRRNLARVKLSDLDLILAEQDDKEYKSGNNKDDKYLKGNKEDKYLKVIKEDKNIKNINFFIIISSFSFSNLDISLSFKDIYFFIINNIDYILFMSLLISFYVLWIRIDKFINIWFQNKQLEEDQVKKRKWIINIKIFLSFLYLVLFLVFWPSDYIFFSLLSNNKIGYRIVKFGLIYVIHSLTIYINIKTKGLYSWSSIFSYFNLLVTIVLTILFILNLTINSSVHTYSILNFFIIGHIIIWLMNALFTFTGLSINTSVSINEKFGFGKKPINNIIEELKSKLNKKHVENDYSSINRNLNKVGIKIMVGSGSENEISNPTSPKKSNEFKRVSIQSMITTDEELKNEKRKANDNSNLSDEEMNKKRRLRSPNPSPISNELDENLSEHEIDQIHNQSNNFSPRDKDIDPFIVSSLSGPALSTNELEAANLDEMVNIMNRVNFYTKEQHVHPLDRMNWSRLNMIRESLLYQEKISPELSQKLEGLLVLSERDKDVNGFLVGPGGITRALLINDYNFRRKLNAVLKAAIDITNNPVDDSHYTRVRKKPGNWFHDVCIYYIGLSNNQRRDLIKIIKEMKRINEIEMNNDIIHYNALIEHEVNHVPWNRDQKYNNDHIFEKAVAFDKLLEMDSRIKPSLFRFLRDYVNYSTIQSEYNNKIMTLIVNQYLSMDNPHEYLRTWSNHMNRHHSIREFGSDFQFSKLNSEQYRTLLWKKKFELARELQDINNFRNLQKFSHYGSLNSRYQEMKRYIDYIIYIDKTRPLLSQEIEELSEIQEIKLREDREKLVYYRQNKTDIIKRMNSMSFMSNYIPLLKNFHLDEINKNNNNNNG
jgi:hypothetical protein